MRVWLMSAVALAALACGGAESGAQDTKAAEQQAEDVLGAILAGERETQSPAVCDLLKSGIVSEVFGVDEAAVNYRPASKIVPHPLCTASWDAVSVSLTLTKSTFDSPAAAVASLESTVAELEEGLTITVAGRERTTQVDFDDWLEGVGDRAAWAPRLNELSVAAGGRRFAVAVSGLGEGAANQQKAIEVAKRVAGGL